MPAITQAQLDGLLDQTFSVPVRHFPGAAPNVAAQQYAALVQRLPNSVLSFAPRTLLHAIGTKAISISVGRIEAVRVAHRYVHILALESGRLRFRDSKDSDNRTNESREVGIGVTCLLASRVWHFPWDQLEPIRGPGKRFDYRAEVNGLTGIFEAKGSTYLSVQRDQVLSGLAKKAAHHKRNGPVDVELIVATRVGVGPSHPEIVIADPPFEVPEETFGPRGEKVYRYRHWTRVMRYIGAPRLAQAFYEDSSRIARGMELRPRRRPRRDYSLPDYVDAHGARYRGHWYRSSFPDIAGYEARRQTEREWVRSDFEHNIEVFQGLREDLLYDADDRGPEALASTLPTDSDWEPKESPQAGAPVSVFSDGTAFAVRIARG